MHSILSWHKNDFVKRHFRLSSQNHNYNYVTGNNQMNQNLLQKSADTEHVYNDDTNLSNMHLA